MKRISLVAAVLFLLTSCSSTKKTTEPVRPSVQIGGVQQAEVMQIFFNANKEKILGNYDNAAQLFSEVIRRDGKNAAAMYELSNIYSAQKKYSDALFFSKSAYSIDPSNSWYVLNYADILQKNKRFAEAADVLGKLVQSFPDRPDYYYEWAASLIYAEKPNEAIKAYDKLESKIGVSKEVSTQKSRLYQRINKNDKAVDELQKLIASDPTDAQAYGMLAEVYQAMGQKQKALDTYNKILLVDPDNPYIHLSLADYYRTEGNKEESLVELKKAFSNKNLDIETKISILSSYYALIEIHPELREQALEMCRLLIVSHPNEPRAYAVYGDFLDQDKKTTEAREQYLKAKELGSKEFIVYSKLLFLDAQLLKWDTLKAESEEALTLFPDQPIVYYFNGVANVQLKKYPEAISSFNSGVKLVVDNKNLEGQFYASLGDVYNEIKDYPKSDASYLKALDINPKDANVLNNYAYFLSLRGEKLEKAEEMSRLSNQLEPTQASYQDTYGWIMYKLGRFKEAKEWIEKSIAGSNNDVGATLYEHYGDVMFKLGDTSKAIEFWMKAKNAGEGTSENLDRKIQEKKMFE